MWRKGTITPESGVMEVVRVGPILFKYPSFNPFYIFLDFGSSNTDLSYTNFSIRVYIASSFFFSYNSFQGGVVMQLPWRNKKK